MDGNVPPAGRGGGRKDGRRERYRDGKVEGQGGEIIEDCLLDMRVSVHRDQERSAVRRNEQRIRVEIGDVLTLRQYLL